MVNTNLVHGHLRLRAVHGTHRIRGISRKVPCQNGFSVFPRVFRVFRVLMFSILFLFLTMQIFALIRVI